LLELYKTLVASMSRVLNQRVGILFLKRSVNFVNLFFIYPKIHALAHAKKMDFSGNVLPPTLIMLEF
jgi:hypothetical protein